MKGKLKILIDPLVAGSLLSIGSILYALQTFSENVCALVVILISLIGIVFYAYFACRLLIKNNK